MILSYVLLAALLVAGILAAGEIRWRAGTRRLRAELQAARRPVAPGVFDSGELESLPAPVRRYFRAVLTKGQPMVAGVNLHHTGSINLAEAGERWKPFASTQLIIAQRPGFDWDAKIRLLPGVSVRVHDAYVAGEGILRAEVYGLVSQANLRGRGELARGELMRYLAEGAWYPTALLPSQGVAWTAVDDRSARATLQDGVNSVTLLFRFGEDGPIDSIRAEARGRMSGNRVVLAPWVGRFWNHAWRHGMRVPLNGEVAWAWPEGLRPYWRGQIRQLSYEFARPAPPAAHAPTTGAREPTLSAA